MKILVIEDEKKSALQLEKGLRESGYAVDVAAEGEAGLRMALEGEYDLIVLDVMLPGRDGWSVMADLRQAGKMTPVLFLTARDTVEDRVKGLELGADDYLVKPFAFSELLARVKSVLRRNPSRQPEIVKVGELELDLFRQRATRNGKKMDLTPKEFAMLSLLARRAGEVLSRNTIADEVWDMNFDSDTNVVDVHVRRLRSKLDDPYEKKIIQTVRGVGYVINNEPS
jgi:two-component system, OmpR family, copper resistance phosphate regulon response regulator CusR